MSINRVMDKMWYIYTTVYSSDKKRNEIGSFLEMWTDLESVIQAEVSQKERDNYTDAYTWNLKNGADDLICRAEIETQIQ